MEIDLRPDYRARISEALRRVPNKARNGSVQDAKAYKKFYESAQKTLNKPTATLQQLITLESQLSTWN